MLPTVIPRTKPATRLEFLRVVSGVAIVQLEQRWRHQPVSFSQHAFRVLARIVSSVGVRWAHAGDGSFAEVIGGSCMARESYAVCNSIFCDVSPCRQLLSTSNAAELDLHKIAIQCRRLPVFWKDRNLLGVELIVWKYIDAPAPARFTGCH